jgi:hypothetical protein
MKVEGYTFGKSTIGGTTYDRDLILTPGGVVSTWWRGRGHRLVLDDLRDVDLGGARRIVVGTGYFGRMSVDGEVPKHFHVLGVQFTAVHSRRAVAAFNEAGEGAALAIHLTC